MTNTEIIRAALLLAGIAADGVPTTAEQAADGLNHLNDMLAEWDADAGINVGWYPQTLVGATAPVFDDAMSAVKYNLAVRLAGAYQIEPPEMVLVIAQSGYKRLERDAVKSRMVKSDMRHLNGATHFWDIEQG